VLRLLSLSATADLNLYTLSLHDALPISYSYLDLTSSRRPFFSRYCFGARNVTVTTPGLRPISIAPFIVALFITSGTEIPNRFARSEEHTSELQSRFDLVCRLLLEKKNNS